MEAGNQPPQPSLVEASKGKQPQPRRKITTEGGKSAPSKRPFHFSSEGTGQESQPRKRKRTETPAVAKKPRRQHRPQGQEPPAAFQSFSHQDGWYDPSNEAQLKDTSSIRPKDSSQIFRSYTNYFPPEPKNPTFRGTIDYVTSRHRTSLLKRRSKLHRANLKALRDFPRTLEDLVVSFNSESDSDYTLIPRADSIPTSGQSTPESPLEPISNEELFGLRARPVSPAPPTPSTPRSPASTQVISSGSEEASTSNSSSSSSSSFKP